MPCEASLPIRFYRCRRLALGFPRLKHKRVSTRFCVIFVKSENPYNRDMLTEKSPESACLWTVECKLVEFDKRLKYHLVTSS